MAQAQEKEVKDTDIFFLACPISNEDLKDIFLASIFNSLVSHIELCTIDLRLYK